jgi:hypothetical protein
MERSSCERREGSTRTRRRLAGALARRSRATRSRVVGKKGDADALDAEVKRAKRLGGMALVNNSRETLDDFAKAWWNRYAVPNLQRHTLLGYASMLDVHIIPRLGQTPLRSLTPELIGEMRAEMVADGVGEPAIRKTAGSAAEHPRARRRVAAA